MAENKATLGDRMKSLERRSETIIPEKSSFVIRLDGRGFSKFTGHMQQPWDPRFTTAMALTASDLLIEFNAASCYVQSDEISMCFPLKINKTTGEVVKPMFSGRIQKLTSCTAGFASARFNYHLRRLYTANLDKHQSDWYALDQEIISLSGKYSIEASFPLRYKNLEEDLKDEKLEIILTGRAHFDSRLIYFDEGQDYEITNSLLWRARDCFRNAVSKTIQHRVGHKRCIKLRTDDKVKLMDEEFPGDLEAIPNSVLYGIFMTKQNYNTIILDNKGLEKLAVRTKVVMFSGDMKGASQEEKTSWNKIIYGNLEIDDALECLRVKATENEYNLVCASCNRVFSTTPSNDMGGNICSSCPLVSN